MRAPSTGLSRRREPRGEYQARIRMVAGSESGWALSGAGDAQCFVRDLRERLAAVLTAAGSGVMSLAVPQAPGPIVITIGRCEAKARKWMN